MLFGEQAQQTFRNANNLNKATQKGGIFRLSHDLATSANMERSLGDLIWDGAWIKSNLVNAIATDLYEVVIFDPFQWKMAT